MPTRDEIVRYLFELPESDYAEILSDVERVRREEFERETEDDPLPLNAERDVVAAWLARKHLAVDNGISEIYYLQDSPSDEIRLIEVNRLLNLPQSDCDAISALDFGLDLEGLNYSLSVADVTPEQMVKLLAGQLQLPTGWSLQPYQRFMHLRA